MSSLSYGRFPLCLLCSFLRRPCARTGAAPFCLFDNTDGSAPAVILNTKFLRHMFLFVLKWQCAYRIAVSFCREADSDAKDGYADMTASSSLPFHESPYRYFVMRNLYESAVKQLVLKLEILNSEFNTLYARNPIHHIESRVKSSESIAAKLQRKGSPVTLEAAVRDINDIAGVRVVCNYIDDVYRVAGMLERQEDLEIVKRQDYIKTPNYNGYRSLHLDVRVPVYLSNRTEHVVAEIQIRTIAMDFWASLEHDIHYKADRAKLPAGIDEEMFACAEKIAEIDRQMQDMYRRIADAEANGDAVKK